MKDYPPYFSRNELICKCPDNNCIGKTQDFDGVFINYLIAAREMAQIPFIISSGARCKSWNQAQNGSPRSSHISSEDHAPRAVDIACSGATAYKIVRACIRVGMGGIGISQKKGEPQFIHVDNSIMGPRPLIWSY